MSPPLQVRPFGLAAVLALGLAVPVAAQTVPMSTIFSFDALDATSTYNQDGNQPEIYADGGDGYVYGMANNGGANGHGTVFKLKYNGSSFTLLHTFGSGSDGTTDPTQIVLRGTVIYGVTSGFFSGAGTVFKINTDGSGYQILATISTGKTSGAPTLMALSPDGSTLAFASSGGGTNNSGALFTMPTSGSTLTTVHNFTSGTDGSGSAGLVFSSDGQTLYGCNRNGGTNGSGTVFALALSGNTFTVLYTFSATTGNDNSDGSQPVAGLVLGPGGGTLYGVTQAGGTSGGGTFYSVAVPSGTFTAIHSFSGGASDGGYPSAMALVGSTLYGINWKGGAQGAGTFWEYGLSTSAPASAGSSNHARASAPFTVSGPTDVVVPIGQNAGFSVEASASASNGELTFYNFSSSDAYGSVGSPIAGTFCVVNGNLIAALNGGGANGYAQILDGVLPVPPNPGETFSYQWFGTQPGGAQAVAIVGATSSSLSLTGVVEDFSPVAFGGTFNGVVYYGPVFCVVTDQNGNTVNSASANIHVPPYIISQPDEVDLPVDSSGLFVSASVGGSPNIAVTWQIDNQTGLSGTSINLLPTVTNASATDPIHPSSPDVDLYPGSYFYSFTATNAYGSVTSIAAEIIITLPSAFSYPTGPSPVSFNQQPAAQSIAPGATATLTAGATGDPSLTYTWYVIYDGTDIPQAVGSGSSLVISNFGANNAGEYYCAASGSAGDAALSQAVYVGLQGGDPPVITQQPGNEIYDVKQFGDATATFTVEATGSATLMYEWSFTPESPGASPVPVPSSGPTLSVPFTKASLGTYTCTVTNAYGSATTEASTLSAVEAPPEVGSIAPITTELGKKVVLSAGVIPVGTGGASIDYSFVWYYPGGGTAVTATTGVSSANETVGQGGLSSDLTIQAASESDAGTWTCVVTDPTTGLQTTVTVEVNVNSGSGPSLSNEPGGAGPVNVPPGGTVALDAENPDAQVATQAVGQGSLGARASSPVTYQWQFNGQNIVGAVDAILVLQNATAADAGTYACIVTVGSASTTSNPAVVTVNSASPGYLVNLSARAFVGSGGANNLTGGFVSTGSKKLLMRGIGPTLAVFGVTGALPDPSLTLYNSGGTAVATNTAWGGTAALSQAFSQTGAFALSANSADTALLETLAGGSYTFSVSSQSGTTGVALAEVYDDDTAPPASQLINLSARALVESGANILVGGFVIGGGSAQTVLLRGIGPTLSVFGVPGVLAQPTLTLYNSQGVAIQSNSGWGGDAALANVFSQVGAFSLNASSADAALLVTLPPGSYTVQVTGPGSATGVALAEIYLVP